VIICKKQFSTHTIILNVLNSYMTGVLVQKGGCISCASGDVPDRLSFVPIVVFFHGKKSARIDRSLQAAMTSIG
jgi:hypothetical protein